MIALTLPLLLIASVTSALKLPTVIGSNMVLQREPAAARLWGWFNVSEVVTVALDGGAAAPVTQYANGSWVFELAPQPAGAGHTITVSSSTAPAQILTNIAFGDVWLCSGQSNMQFSVNDVFNASAEIADSINYPNLRLFTVALTVADSPQYDCLSGANYNWGVSSPASFVGVGGAAFSWFSATCYFFGRDTYIALGGDVPIGLIASDWGGQAVEAFSSPDALADQTCGGTRPAPSVGAVNTSIELELAAADAPNPAPNPGPMQLWYAMIYPLLPMRMVGATWYQGEANAGDPPSYACRFPAMIYDWRLKFGLPDFSFFFVQLAAFSQDYSAIRQAQMAGLLLPKVGYAVAIDIGDPQSPEGDIHPRRKQEVGRRLSLSAQAIQYNLPVTFLGPNVSSYQLTQVTAFGGRVTCGGFQFVYSGLPDGRAQVTVQLNNAGSTLHANGTAACVACCNESPFVIGDGVVMLRANFTITGPSTVVATTDVPVQAKMFQFDFEGYPQCALYNGVGGPDDHAGLPMIPFQSPQPPPLNYTLV